jgi:dolichyl-diphosphooligosaccharide--protein glycosyltransferase
MAESFLGSGAAVDEAEYGGAAATAAIVSRALGVDLEWLCVMAGPFASAATVLAVYTLALEVATPGAALLAAALVSIAPGLAARTGAGLFSGEVLAGLVIVLALVCWLRALRLGSMAWSCASALLLVYLTSLWQGHLFVSALVALHVLALLAGGAYSPRLYVAYSSFFAISLALSGALTTGFSAAPETAFGPVAFAALQARALVASRPALARPVAYAGVLAAAALAAAGYLSLGWSGKLRALVDPAYAFEAMPLVALDPEQQPATWANLFFDLHLVIIAMPAGLYYCFKDLTEARVLLIAHALTALYLASAMIRLVSVLVPAACIAAAIALTGALDVAVETLRRGKAAEEPSAASSEDPATGKRKARSHSARGAASSFDYGLACATVGVITVLLAWFVVHSTWAISEFYSAPAGVVAAKTREVLGDLRETQDWLVAHTRANDRVIAWGAQSYQVLARARRTGLIRHKEDRAEEVAAVLLAPEAQVGSLLADLGADYALVFCGAFARYRADDVAAAPWMAKLAGSGPFGGADAPVDDEDLSVVGEGAAPRLLASTLYRLAYFNFANVTSEYGKPPGFDRARREVISQDPFTLKNFKEVFTSQNWLYRVFKVVKN